MSEDVAKYEVKPKREPVTVRLNKEVILLGRSLAKNLHGSEDKFGNLIEDAINYLSAHQEGEVRTNALLRTTEETLFGRFNNQVESMYKSFTDRDNKLTKRIGGLIAVSSFETALTELMLKEIFCRDEKSKARYEELRSLASKKMKDRYEKANVTEVLELQERVRDLEKELQEWKDSSDAWEDDCATEKAKKDDMTQKYNETYKNLSELKNKYNDAVDVLKGYVRLVEWYEKRDKAIPEIQEKNKKLLSKQPYEEALKEYDTQHYKPQVKSISFK